MMLDDSNVIGYLSGRGLIEDGPADVSTLGGGVSNVTLAVAQGDTRLVVKQALPRLRVADEWLAPPGRAVTEAKALRLAARITPGRVPEVLDSDPEDHVLVIAHAPPGWTDWKGELLAGCVEASVATELGAALGAWHLATTADPAVAAEFDGSEAFEKLRVDPYYRTVMARRPEIADEVQRYVDDMAGRRRCLVHGDYSPKNVLVGAEGLWVVDWEVAHLGDPAFDVAFMCNHLMLKAIHRPGSHGPLMDAAVSFWEAYEQSGAGALDPRYVIGHAGCLMAARVDGKSPAEYLSSDDRRTARALGASLLTEPPEAVRSAFDRLDAYR